MATAAEGSRGEARLRLEGVHKSFDGLAVLTDIDLEVAEGEFVAIVGPSGCGKSTILRIAAGLEFPSSGRVTMDGEPVTGPHPSRGLIFQEHGLYPWRTVEQNTALGLELSGVGPEERRRRARAMLERVGLSGFEGYYPHQLSGGMRQRAAIARSLIVDPEVLLLDEPFGALDAITRLHMQSELLRLWQGSGKAVLLITHDIDEAIYLADRVVVMSARPGRILAAVPVDLPRPRNRNDMGFARLRDAIGSSLSLAF